jgi:chaperonin GroES
MRKDPLLPTARSHARGGPRERAVPAPRRRVALIDVSENIVPSPAGKLPIKMLHDRILVALRKEDGERRSTGGILIPATAQVAKRLVWGEARGVGGSVRQVKVGDQVLFSPDDQHEVEVHGEDLIILRERDVHAVAAERIEESTGLYL